MKNGHEMVLPWEWRVHWGKPGPVELSCSDGCRALGEFKQGPVAER